MSEKMQRLKCARHSWYSQEDCPYCCADGLKDENTKLRKEIENLGVGLDAKQLEIVALTEERDHLLSVMSSEKVEAPLRSLQQAAGELVRMLRDVGERSGWKDGIETDRVFSWDDFSKLRALLPLEIMSGSSEQP